MRSALRAVLAALAACTAAAPAAAQTVATTAEACLDVCAPAFSVTFSGVRVGGTTVGLRLGSASLGLDMMAAETFGPLGNVVFEAVGDLRLVDGPLARGRLSARGVVASVAARLAASAGGADDERFDPLAVAGDGPLLGGPRLGLEAGGTFRLSRRAVLDVAPAVYSGPHGLASMATATLRLVRALGEDELQARLGAALLPGGEGHAALGAALVLTRGRAPDWELAAYLGYGSGRVQPGGSASLAEGLADGGRVSLTASYEPYRRDVRPLRATATLELPVAGATARLELAAGASHPRAADAVAGRLSLVWPFGR